MASSFSANQYDSAFRSQRLQNWCEAKHFKERPTARATLTSFVADNKGHLLPGVKKGSAWPDFKGTWDLPTRIPAHHIDPTARSAEGLSRLRSWGFCPQQSAKSQRGGRSVDVGEQTTEDGTDPAPPAEASVGGNQSRRLQTDVSVSAERHIQTSEKDRTSSRTSANQKHSASSPTDGKKSPNGPETEERRPQSNVPVQPGSKGQTGRPKKV